MMKKLLTIATFGLLALSFQSAYAHGAPAAKHGGIVATASDLAFELVRTPDGALIYIDDHGKPKAPTGMKGTLTVLQGTARSQAELVVAGDKLQAKGVQLAPGARVVAALTTPAGQAITVRFTVK